MYLFLSLCLTSLCMRGPGFIYITTYFPLAGLFSWEAAIFHTVSLPGRSWIWIFALPATEIMLWFSKAPDPCGLPSSTAPKLCRSPEWGAGQLLEAFSSLPEDATLLRCKPEILQLQLEARNVNCSQVNSDAKVSSLLWSHLSLESYGSCCLICSLCPHIS